MDNKQVKTGPTIKMEVKPAETPRRFDWVAGFWAGIIAGAIFIILQSILAAAVYGNSFWGPLKMIAGIVMGGGVVTAPMNVGVFIVGIVIHFILAVIFGYIGLLIIRPLGPGGAIFGEGIYGILLYLVNIGIFAAVLFPWFRMARNWITFMDHIIYGIILGLSYLGLRRYPASVRQVK
jgi:hypothetical protein